jgi:cyclic pyranopterin phosphate synthase
MTPAKKAKLSHVNARGAASMVNVGNKTPTERRAIAEGFITMSAAALKAVRANAIKKGDVLAVARIAGIQAAKRTAELIPLCHPLALTDVQVDFRVIVGKKTIHATSTRGTVGQTGVEMEALTAVAVALLTVYDMAKSVDKGMRIHGVRLLEKTGGKSGIYRAKR